MRPRTVAAVLLLVSGACGGGSDAGPVQPEAPAVATVQVTTSTPSVLVGVSVVFSAVARDAQGATISGKAFTWSTSNASVATVAAGQVATLAPGSATISATVDGRSGGAPLEVVDPRQIPAFNRPFAASTSYFTTNFSDHDVPISFFDNGRKISYWGEQYDVVGYEGHEGYDWRMAEGTPVLAVAAGRVVSVSTAAFFCEVLQRDVPADGNGAVFIEHDLPGGVRVRTYYAHLSRKDVTLGQQVTQGQQIGLSGGVGCALNPHLHLGVHRLTQTNNGQGSLIDPYGWEGASADPWVGHPAGAASIRLWRPGEAPDLFVRYPIELNAEGGTSFFGMTAVQVMGVRDAQNPNNEYVEVSRDPRYAPATLDIGGSTIRTRGGTVYTFPAGTTLSASVPTIRVYSGLGTAITSTLYMGRTTPAYDNVRECVAVYNAAGLLRNRIGLGQGGCA